MASGSAAQQSMILGATDLLTMNTRHQDRLCACSVIVLHWVEGCCWILDHAKTAQLMSAKSMCSQNLAIGLMITKKRYMAQQKGWVTISFWVEAQFQQTSKHFIFLSMTDRRRHCVWKELKHQFAALVCYIQGRSLKLLTQVLCRGVVFLELHGFGQKTWNCILMQLY